VGGSCPVRSIVFREELPNCGSILKLDNKRNTAVCRSGYAATPTQITTRHRCRSLAFVITLTRVRRIRTCPLAIAFWAPDRLIRDFGAHSSASSETSAFIFRTLPSTASNSCKIAERAPLPDLPLGVSGFIFVAAAGVRLALIQDRNSIGRQLTYSGAHAPVIILVCLKSGAAFLALVFPCQSDEIPRIGKGRECANPEGHEASPMASPTLL
jgi:hypothetical protein